MGWAARQKQRDRAEGRQTTCGNPETPAAKVIGIALDKFEAGRHRRGPLLAKFSDRTYRMDVHGTLRRLPPVATASATYSIRTLQSPEV